MYFLLHKRKNHIVIFSEPSISNNTPCSETTTEPTLYLHSGSLRGYIAQIVAKYTGKCLKIQNHTTESKQEGLVVYKDKDIKLSDSNAIAFYLANAQLKGSDTLTQSQILQWMSISDNHILPSVCGWVLPSIGSTKISKDSIKESKHNLLQIMDVLNNTLLSKTFLVGERITLADLTVFAGLLPAYEHVFDPQLKEKYQNVNRWFETVLQQSNVKSIITNFNYYEKK